jgi:two-component system, NarL family, response regulator
MLDAADSDADKGNSKSGLNGYVFACFNLMAMEAGHRIRILVADDHPLIRDGLSAILNQENDLEIVGQAADGEAACQLYEKLLPDILLLDLRMPKKDGMQVIHELMPRSPRPLIVVLTTSEKEQDLRVALKAGVKGYVLKGAESSQVVQTIRDVFAGKSSLSPEAAAKLAESMSHPQLSPRELEVLEYMAEGKSNKEIGHSLYLSEHTVKNYVKTILRKLDAPSRTGAIAIALERGLIQV